MVDSAVMARHWFDKVDMERSIDERSMLETLAERMVKRRRGRSAYWHQPPLVANTFLLSACVYGVVTERVNMSYGTNQLFDSPQMLRRAQRRELN